MVRELFASADEGKAKEVSAAQILSFLKSVSSANEAGEMTPVYKMAAEES